MQADEIRIEQVFAYYGVPADRRTISSMLAAVAALRPAEMAVSDGSRALSWRELDQAASAFAEQLTGLQRFAVVSPDTIEVLLAMYGCARAHVAFCPLPTPFTTVELKMTFERLGVDAVYAPGPFEERVTKAGFGPDRVRRLEPDWTARADSRVRPGRSVHDVVWVIWTSGSTASPKPVLVPERAALLAGAAYSREMGTGPGDKWLNFFPFFHLSGCWIAMHCLAAQCPQRLLPDGFEAREALHAIMHEGVSRVGGFELFWTRLRALPEWADADLSGLTAAGMSGNLSLYDMLEELGVPLINSMYGSTEAGFSSLTRRDDTDRDGRKFSNGHPTFGTEVRIVDPDTGRDAPVGERGEIWTRGPFSSLGYLDGDPAKVFDAHGWVHSGDLGWLDQDGRLYFRGKIKHVVKSGGENVSCREVEIALETLCEDVVTAQVVGAPDPEWGEAVVAFVELRPGSGLEVDKIKGVLRQNLAGFKIPKEYVEVRPGTWPITGNGKIHRAELEAVAAQVRSASLAG
jgi:acyl-CoA synthetase (AMP-forming)/AMP-acid ligase II